MIEFFDWKLQPTHPLRQFKLYPVAKLWRKYKFLIRDEDNLETLWVLDMDRKKRVKGKTCYYFKQIKTQEELDEMLASDLVDWVQYMKDAGAWGD